MNVDRLSLNTATLKPYSLEEIVKQCERRQIKAIGPWRDKIHETGLDNASRLFRDAGLHVSGLCRGGFFTADGYYHLDDNKRAVDEAAALNADCLVIVSGGLKQGSKDIADARKYIAEGLALVTEYGRSVGMPIALEPLHPMYAADRCAINTLKHALDICEQVGTGIGVAIDAYHVWWDPQLRAQVERAGELGCILGYHVCDWLVPTKDLLLDRGMMGDGIIDLKSISDQIADAGYNGYVEVEIFSEELWSKKAEEIMELTVRQFERFV